MTTMPEQTADVVVVGGGVAGLSAALSAAERSQGHAHVVLLEKATQQEAGGNTSWTDAYFRLADVYEPADGFVEDMLAFSQGKTDPTYVDTLVEELPEAMEWVQSHGVRFQRRATYFVTASKPRMMPVGGGEALVRSLTQACRERGVDIRYAAPLTDLRQTDSGFVVTTGGDDDATIACTSCVIASGGFEGDPERLATHMGESARAMKPIAPGGRFNTGEVIDLAVALGASTSGEWSNFHGEPVDSRSSQAEASVMVFPYGILVNNEAQRFIDEGIGTVDETYEDVARAILAQPGVAAYLISDASFDAVPGVERGLLTDRKPVRSETLEELAEALELDSDALAQTMCEFNEAVQDDCEYDPRVTDGRSTSGLTPPKSNWAKRIETPPFVGIPLTTDIVFTYGGLSTDERARVLGADGAPIPGLFAAGECTGIYHHKYPGATSVMRGLVFGRIAGREATVGVVSEG